ncbi:ankyrin repeat-containing domain protein [Nemania abortiva]|nr:ankyrin repeat-containing domain protein [Nemania abortiva]
MCWACDEGRVDTVQRLLEAGADPNAAWSQNEPRWWTLQTLTEAVRHASRRRWPDGDEEQGQGHGHGREHGHDEEQEESGDQEDDASPRNALRVLAQEIHREDYIQDIRHWMGLHTTVAYSMNAYFEDDTYDVDDKNLDGGGGNYSTEGGWMESVPWSYSWNPYRSVKTFTQRCYWAPLHIAAAWGNDKLVNLLLDYGADVNALSRLFCSCAATLSDRKVAPLWTPLHTAMCHGYESTARLLLSRGASTNVTTKYRGQDERRFTALHSACVLGSADVARALLDGGYQTDVTVCDHLGFTPLAHAFFRGNWAVIDVLLEHGVDLNAKIGPLSAFGHACVLGYYAEALRLLDLGATIQCEPEVPGLPPVCFHLAAIGGNPDSPSFRSSEQRGFQLELVNRLIKHGVDVNQRVVSGFTALVGAASFHRVGMVKALLQSGADPRPGTKWCALESAVSLAPGPTHKTPKGAMLETVQALLEAMGATLASKSVDVDISVAFEHLCSASGKHDDMFEVAALLLRYARVAEIAGSRKDLVSQAMHMENFDIANLLLDNGFHEPTDEEFETLIEHFIEEDVFEGLRHILDRFPDMDPLIRCGELLCNAVDVGSEHCVEFLIDEGVSINSRDADGNSLLLTACMMGDKRTAEVLLKKGANPDECTKDGELMTIVAALEESYDIVDLLLDYGASIHSSPPSRQTLRSDPLGFLDITISLGLLDAIEVIVNHKNYGTPTDEEMARHWQVLINAPVANDEQVAMVEILLASEKFDPNQVLTSGNDKSLTTPLHMSAALGGLVDKTELIEELITRGADIHNLLAVPPDRQPQGRRPESESAGKFRFEGTTPLSWAIEFSSMGVVRTLLQHEDLFLYNRVGQRRWHRLKVLCAKAACRRQKPRMFTLLFGNGFSPNITDKNGNTMIHMICNHVERSWRNSIIMSSMEFIAERAVDSLIACLQQDAKTELENKKGVSGTDRILRIMNYSGNCVFHRTLSKFCRERIEYMGDGSSPHFQVLIPLSDDSDWEDDLLDMDDFSDDSDDEPSDMGQDLESDYSDGEAYNTGQDSDGEGSDV